MEKITESCLAIMLLFFIDNLVFITFRHLIKELAKIFGQIAAIILDWEKFNAVIYNVAKTKAVFFSKAHY